MSVATTDETPYTSEPPDEEAEALDLLHQELGAVEVTS
jgi:hypothetical protein